MPLSITVQVAIHGEPAASGSRTFTVDKHVSVEDVSPLCTKLVTCLAEEAEKVVKQS